MKKTYIRPEKTVLLITGHSMLATSKSITEDTQNASETSSISLGTKEWHGIFDESDWDNE